MVVLEDLDRARRRNAPIYGEIIGYGATADAYRITDIHPEGRGAIACMRMALQDAGISAEEVHYVNAHGTSTAVNDRVETVACKEVFGARASQVPISSTKSMMGHLIAAAGVTELIVCLMAIRDQRPAPHDQLRKSRSRLRPGLCAQRGPRGQMRRRTQQQLRLWRSEHHADRQPLRRVILTGCGTSRAATAPPL